MDKVDICNLAIGWCGGNLIMTLDDDSTEADLCKTLYGPTRDLVLEQRDWTFAASRDSLTPLANPPAFGYSQQFQLPSNLLVVRQVSDEPDSMRPVRYVKEQRTLLSDAAILYIKYTVKVTNEVLFSPTFVYALAHKIAAGLANPLTQNASLKKEMELISQMYIDEGGAIDGTQTIPGRTVARRIVGARYGGRGRRGTSLVGGFND